jgi:hypothetical protein
LLGGSGCSWFFALCCVWLYLDHSLTIACPTLIWFSIRVRTRMEVVMVRTMVNIGWSAASVVLLSSH